MIGKIGEKIEVSEYIHMKGETVVPYIHAGSKLGVLVSLKGINGKDVTEAGKDVGMQIAAMNPVAVDEKSVDRTLIEKELEIAKPRLSRKVNRKIWGKIARVANNFSRKHLAQSGLCEDNSRMWTQYPRVFKVSQLLI